MMRNIDFAVAGLAAVLIVTAVPALADCKDEVKEVQDDIDKNKDNYTQKAKVEARKHLVAAEVPSAKLADCRREVRAAKQALRKGKK